MFNRYGYGSGPMSGSGFRQPSSNLRQNMNTTVNTVMQKLREHQTQPGQPRANFASSNQTQNWNPRHSINNQTESSFGPSRDMQWGVQGGNFRSTFVPQGMLQNRNDHQPGSKLDVDVKNSSHGDYSQNISQDAENSEKKFYCELCNIRFSEMKYYDVHINGILHQRNKEKFSKVTGRHTGQQIKNMPEKPEEFICKACRGIRLNNVQAWEGHIESRPHCEQTLRIFYKLGKEEFLKQFSDLKFSTKLDSQCNDHERNDLDTLMLMRSGFLNNFMCKVCVTKLNTRHNWIEHMKGKRHARRFVETLQAIGEDQYWEQYGDVPQPKDGMQQEYIPRYTPRNEQFIPGDNLGDAMKPHPYLSKYGCRICEQNFETDEQLSQHVETLSHNQAVLWHFYTLGPTLFEGRYGEVQFSSRVENQCQAMDHNDIGVLMNMRSAYMNAFYCRLCKMKCPQRLNWIEHIAGKRHNKAFLETLYTLGVKEYRMQYGDVPRLTTERLNNMLQTLEAEDVNGSQMMMISELRQLLTHPFRLLEESDIKDFQSEHDKKRQMPPANNQQQLQQRPPFNATMGQTGLRFPGQSFAQQQMPRSEPMMSQAGPRPHFGEQRASFGNHPPQDAILGQGQMQQGPPILGAPPNTMNIQGSQGLSMNQNPRMFNQSGFVQPPLGGQMMNAFPSGPMMTNPQGPPFQQQNVSMSLQGMNEPLRPALQPMHTQQIMDPGVPQGSGMRPMVSGNGQHGGLQGRMFESEDMNQQYPSSQGSVTSSRIPASISVPPSANPEFLKSQLEKQLLGRTAVSTGAEVYDYSHTRTGAGQSQENSVLQNQNATQTNEPFASMHQSGAHINPQFMQQDQFGQMIQEGSQTNVSPDQDRYVEEVKQFIQEGGPNMYPNMSPQRVRSPERHHNEGSRYDEPRMRYSPEPDRFDVKKDHLEPRREGKRDLTSAIIDSVRNELSKLHGHRDRSPDRFRSDTHSSERRRSKSRQHDKRGDRRDSPGSRGGRGRSSNHRRGDRRETSRTPDRSFEKDRMSKNLEKRRDSYEDRQRKMDSSRRSPRRDERRREPHNSRRDADKHDRKLSPGRTEDRRHSGRGEERRGRAPHSDARRRSRSVESRDERSRAHHSKDEHRRDDRRDDRRDRDDRRAHSQRDREKDARKDNRRRSTSRDRRQERHPQRDEQRLPDRRKDTDRRPHSRDRAADNRNEDRSFARQDPNDRPVRSSDKRSRVEADRDRHHEPDSSRKQLSSRDRREQEENRKIDLRHDLDKQKRSRLSEDRQREEGGHRSKESRDRRSFEEDYKESHNNREPLDEYGKPRDLRELIQERKQDLRHKLHSHHDRSTTEERQVLMDEEHIVVQVAANKNEDSDYRQIVMPPIQPDRDDEDLRFQIQRNNQLPLFDQFEAERPWGDNQFDNRDDHWNQERERTRQNTWEEEFEGRRDYDMREPIHHHRPEDNPARISPLPEFRTAHAPYAEEDWGHAPHSQNRPTNRRRRQEESDAFGEAAKRAKTGVLDEEVKTGFIPKDDMKVAKRSHQEAADDVVDEFCRVLQQFITMLYNPEARRASGGERVLEGLTDAERDMVDQIMTMTGVNDLALAAQAVRVLGGLHPAIVSALSELQPHAVQQLVSGDHTALRSMPEFEPLLDTLLSGRINLEDFSSTLNQHGFVYDSDWRQEAPPGDQPSGHWRGRGRGGRGRQDRGGRGGFRGRGRGMQAHQF